MISSATVSLLSASNLFLFFYQKSVRRSTMTTAPLVQKHNMGRHVCLRAPSSLSRLEKWPSFLAHEIYEHKSLTTNHEAPTRVLSPGSTIKPPPAAAVLILLYSPSSSFSQNRMESEMEIASVAPKVKTKQGYVSLSKDHIELSMF